MLEFGFAMLATSLQAPPWVAKTALVVSVCSAIVTLIGIGCAAYALKLTRERDQREIERDRREQVRDRKKVEITSSIEGTSVGIGDASVTTWHYRCTVTNSGVPAVRIRSVGVRSHGSSGAEIPLKLAKGEEAGVLTQGESQVWEASLSSLKSMFSGPNPVDVVAVATDTADDEYVQDRSKSLPIPLGD